MAKSITESIEGTFRKKAAGDPRVRNAYLLVHSEKLGVDLNLAEGHTGEIAADPGQPNYMASVGKLFTATIIALLHEQGALSFDDRISAHLDAELMDGLHVYKGRNYSGDIQIRHLLNQSSGLPDNFFPLFDKLLEDPEFTMSPREAVEWAKGNLTPSAPPGKKAYYTDTNYHLLGLIVEQVTGKAFHEVLREMIFAPLEMRHASMLHASEPLEDPGRPVGEFYFKNTRLNGMKGLAGIDYTGGGVGAPMAELLAFMKALVNGELVSAATLKRMKDDKARLFPEFDYGYAIWQVRPIPLLLPAKYRSWGVLGSTGAYMFYHPELEAYLIGTFNHGTYQKKAVRFMFKIMNALWKESSRK